MVTRRTTRGRYLGTGEEFVIEDDYANPVDAHRVLANAWVGTTQVFEEKIEKMNGNVNEFKEAWADMDFEDSPDAEVRQWIGTLSSLSAVPVRRCSVPCDSSDGINGSVRQAVGIARSAVSKRPPAGFTLVARPVARSLPECVVSPCRPRSVSHELSSEAPTMAEGECKSDGTHSQMDCTITEARMLLQAGRHCIGDYSIDRVLMNHHCVAQGETLKICVLSASPPPGLAAR